MNLRIFQRRDPAGKPLRIILWGGWYGSRNVGDRLLLLAITNLVRERFKTCHFDILSAQPRLVDEYFRDLPGGTHTVIRPLGQPLALIKAIHSCDMLVFGGAVPFFEQYKQALVMLFLTGLMRILDKPYFLWSVAGYRVEDKFIRAIYKDVIDHASGVTIRDTFTRQYFSEYGTVRECMITPDSALSLEVTGQEFAMQLIEKYVPDIAGRRLFALTPRTLRVNDSEAHTHYTRKKQEDVEHELKCFEIAAGWLIKNGYTPVIFPMNTNPPDDDRQAGREIIGRSHNIGNIYMVDDVIPPLAASALYALCEGSLVSRVHGSITSFTGGCPPIMYAFESKHKGIMSEMGLTDLIFDPAKQPPEKIIDYLEIVTSKHSHFIDLIKGRSEEIKKRIRIPLDEIEGLVLMTRTGKSG